MSLASFDQVPFTRLVDRVDQGNVCLIELLQLFRSKLDLEEKNIAFSTKVSRQNIYEHEIPKSSSEKSLGMMKNYYIFMSQDQVKYHSGLLEIVRKLEALRTHCTTEISRNKEFVQNATKEVAKAHLALDKAKRNYQKAKIEVQQAKAKLLTLQQTFVEWERANEEKRREKERDPTYSASKFSMGRMLSAFEATPEQDRDRQIRRVTKRLGLMEECRIDIAQKKQALLQQIEERDNAIQMATLNFEGLELERLSQTQVSIHTYCELERSALEKRSKNLTKLEQAVSGVDVEADMSLYIEKEKDSELTHRQARALAILDWDYKRRNIQEEEEFDLNQFKSAPEPTVSPQSDHSEEGPPAVSMEEPLDGRSVTPTPSPKIPGPIESSENNPELVSVRRNSGSAAVLSTALPQGVDSASTPPHRRNSAPNPGSGESLLADAVAEPIPSAEGDETDAVFRDVDPLLDSVSSTTNSTKKVEWDGTNLNDLHDGKNSEQCQEIYVDEPSSRVSAVVRALLHQSSRPQLSPNALTTLDTILHEMKASPDDEIMSLDQSSNGLNPQKVEQLLVSDEMSMAGMDDFPVDEDSWTEMLESEEARSSFLKELDGFRGSHGLVAPASFQVLAVAMKALLDHCEEQGDIKSAMRIANMANTFHTMDVNSPVISDHVENAFDQSSCPSAPALSDVAGGSQERVDSDGASVTSIKYLQQEMGLRDHPIWRSEGFWDAALMQGLGQELDHRNAVLWDELSPESCQELIIVVHNMVFGQLGTMVSTMHSVGLGALEIEKRMMNMSRAAQLTEEQEHELLKSVRRIFGMSLDFRQGSRYHSPSNTTKGLARRRESWRDASVVGEGVDRYVPSDQDVRGSVSAPGTIGSSGDHALRPISEEGEESSNVVEIVTHGQQDEASVPIVRSASSLTATPAAIPRKKSGLSIFGSSSSGSGSLSSNSSSSSKSRIRQIAADDGFYAVL